MEKHSTVSAYLTSSGIALFGGLTLQDFAMWVGIVTAIGTFILNWYYRARADRRGERRHRHGNS